MKDNKNLSLGAKLSLEGYIESLPNEAPKICHTKNYDNFINNIEKTKKTKLSKLLKALLVAAVLISLLISSFTVFGKFGSYDDVIAKEIITTTQEESSLSSTTKKAQQASKKPATRVDLQRLNIGDTKNIELISSNEKFSLICSKDDNVYKLSLISQQKNKIVSHILLDYAPVDLAVDDSICVISKVDEGYVSNIYDFDLTKIDEKSVDYNEGKLDGVSYYDDEKQGTLYYFPDEDAYYLTPHHDNMVVQNRFNHKFAFEEKISGGYYIKIKNYALERQINKLKLKNRVVVSNLNNTTYSFVNEKGEAFVWHYKEKKSNRRSSRVTKYTSIQMQSYVDDMIKENGYDIVFDDIALFDQFVCASKLVEYSTKVDFDKDMEIVFTAEIPEDYDGDIIYFDVNAFDFETFENAFKN